jgi:hypothetical protein
MFATALVTGFLGSMLCVNRLNGDPAPSGDTKSPAGFTDITKSCGIDAVIEAHYRHEPKWWLSGTDLVDLDNDGHLDLFLGAHGQTGAVALNDGHGHFRYVEPSPGKLPPTEIHLACDTAAQGAVNLQMTYGDGGGQWWRNESAPGAPKFEATQFTADQGRENAMIDIDRDGNLDWVHEEAGKSAVVFEMGDGKGGFHRGGGFATFKEASAIPVDLDGDGYIDFVMKQCGYNDEHEGHSRIMMNDGHGNFTDHTADCGLPESGVVIQGVGDVNQDGSVDLICLEHGNVAIYLNDGKAHFKKLQNAVTGMEREHKPTYANWGLAVMTEFDNDGIPDLLINGRNFLYILRGTGGGHFVCMNRSWNVPDFAWSAVDEGLCFGDIDNDGRLDLVVSSGSENHKTMSVLHNDLPLHHWLNVRPIGAGGNRPAAGAKIRLLESGTGKLLSYEQIIIAGRQTAHTYYAFGTTERHFGLGDRASVDVRVEFYPSGKVVSQAGVKADQTVEVRE